MSYNPAEPGLLTWHDAVPRFVDGTDTPRAWFEKAIEVIEVREPEVQAFVVTDLEAARKAADASTERYRSGRPLSLLDGMPWAVKDLFKTADFPTEINSPLFEGDSHWLDSAHVYALKCGGAVLVGKTTLPELGSGNPPPTRNPFDLTRTAGASSSGSAAAIGAGMLPLTSGSQGRGSILRPASFCGNYALKPTMGALHSGGLLWRSPGYGVMGLHGGSMTDCWRTARFVADTVGGDPGQPGLIGEPDIGEGRKPSRLALLETAGWDKAEDEYKAKLLAFTGRLRDAGVEIVRRQETAALDAFEQALATIPDFQGDIAAWEIKWPALAVRDRGRDRINPRLVDRFEDGERTSLAEYRAALEKLEAVRAAFLATKDVADGYITLSTPTMPPVGMNTGDSVFGDPSSCLGAPAWNLPLLEDRGLPMGVQLMGQMHTDFDLAQIGRWMVETELGAVT